MNALVVYDSQYGNTERIAHAIADGLRAAGAARAVRADAAQPGDLQGIDLLVVGSPTQGWRATPATQAFLERLRPVARPELAVAGFDTRMRMPRWLTGSAAGAIVKGFRAMGLTPLAPPESFFVAGGEGPLATGEEDHAAIWARALLARAPIAAGR
jgi:flavodoxin